MKLAYLISLLSLLYLYVQPLEKDLGEFIIINKIDQQKKIMAVYTFNQHGKLLSYLNKDLIKGLKGNSTYQMKYYTYNKNKEMRLVSFREDESIEREVTIEYIYSYNENNQPIKLIERNKKSFQINRELEYFYDSTNKKIKMINEIWFSRDSIGGYEKFDSSLYHYPRKIVFTYGKNGELKKKITTENNSQTLELFKIDKDKFSLTRLQKSDNKQAELVSIITQSCNKNNELNKSITENFAEGWLPKQEINLSRNGLINQIKRKSYFTKNGGINIQKYKFKLTSKKSKLNKEVIKLINKTIIESESHQKILRNYILENPTSDSNEFY